MAEAIADPRRREVRQGLISTTLTGRRFFTSIDGLDKIGDPPALLGRHQQFDSNGSPIVTPKREPPSTTLRRNHETSRKFKSHPLGV